MSGSLYPVGEAEGLDLHGEYLGKLQTRPHEYLVTVRTRLHEDMVTVRTRLHGYTGKLQTRLHGNVAADRSVYQGSSIKPTICCAILMIISCCVLATERPYSGTSIAG